MAKRYLTNRELEISDVFPQKVVGCCCYCQKELTGKQKKWCSQDCSHRAFDETMMARGSSTHIRRFVFGRDQGICAKCGIDCEQLQRISDAAFRALEDIFDSTIPVQEYGWFYDEEAKKFRCIRQEKHKTYFKEARLIWKDTGLNFGGSCWQADHILEVKNGGKHEMANFQTLCNFCHKEKTRFLYK